MPDDNKPGGGISITPDGVTFNPLAETREGLDISDDDAAKLLADSGGDSPDTGDDTDWKAEAEKYKALARKHETRAKENARANEQVTRKAQTVEQQLDEMRNQMSARDKRELERNGRLAMSQLNTRLAEAGIKRDDVAGLLKRIQATDLLDNGEPSDEAIGELADSLVKITGRASPDPDQGQKGGKAPLDMNQLIRRAAGITR